MGKYALRRLLMFVPVVVGVTLVAFLLLHLTPGDPAAVVAGPDARPEVVEQIRHQLGLDRPLHVQFATYLKNVVTGHMGRSIITQQEVGREIARVFYNTLELVLVARLWSLLLAVPVGVAAAVRRGSWVDKSTMVVGLLGLSLPIFWIGLVLMWAFGARWGLLPLSGRGGPIWTWQGLTHLILPAVTLGSSYIGSLARMTRSAMLEVLNQEYIRTARSKGLPERTVIYRHALRNALLPVVTVAGLQMAYMLGGAIVTETIFGWPGMGRLAVGAVLTKDFPMVQGVVVVMGIATAAINLGVDLAYARLDPRIRYG